ncbi:phage tail protein [Enterobacter ludwigii]|jgi:phage-related tail fiber protein|uniref:phage tail-collar fiber domain-containing protein n=1 Tax=Enterobacter ludwigii TaxID=299767 RepID=UPI001FB95B47|nr:phage tail protein [Enterobacter ludwigii]MDK9952225.1 phage tail protein [Enterobacter ludwigii]UOH50812.1 phage tail protein [Enterobacter ludwigii]HDR2689834.1 phage tail protein [Enterobacter ludwigii]
MTVKYKTVITKAGAEKLAAATVPNGKKVNFTAMAVGDGGGQLPTPNASQTKLINEVWRHALNKISQDKKNKNYVVAELLIPPEIGGFWMREMGLYDDTGTLIAVGNMAESYKPALAEGSGRAQTVRMVIMVSDIASVELTIDTSTVMATQDYVDDKLAEHEQSRRHPDASLTAKGFTQLSSAIDSVSEVVAATPKAVKVAYDLAKGKYTAQDASTAQKGIVQLSSAIDSVSEVLAATPKAVKAAYDLAKGKYTAQDASTAQKGIVQLSSAIDNVSETLAATPKAVKAAYDNANGRVPSGRKVNGRALTSDINITAQDIFNGQAVGIGNAEDLNAYTMPGLYYQPANAQAQTGKNYPESNAGSLEVYKHAGITQVYRIYNNSRAYIRTLYSGTWSAWTKQYDAVNKPTAGEVDAVSASQGGAFQRTVNFNGGLNVRSATGIFSGGDAASFSDNNMLLKSWYGIGFYCTLTSAGGPEAGITGYINTRNGRLEMKERIIPGDYANFDERYLKLAGGRLSGNLEINNNAPIITFSESDTGKKYFIVADGSGFRINEDSTGGNFVISYAGASKQLRTIGQFVPGDYANFDARYYTKAQSDAGYMPKTSAYTKTESDGRFQAKGSYTPAGQAYTKAESDARYGTGRTTTGNNSAYYTHGNGTVFMQAVRSIAVGNNTAVTVTLPTSFPNGILGTGVSYFGSGGNNSDSFYLCTPVGKNQVKIETHNCNGTFSLIVAGY